jgi:hypothetical protein
MEVIQLYRREQVINALQAFRTQMEIALVVKLQDDSTGALWLLLGDILDLFGLDPDERAQVLGPNVTALLDLVCAQTWHKLNSARDGGEATPKA